jgi:hypothetical protein
MRAKRPGAKRLTGRTGFGKKRPGFVTVYPSGSAYFKVDSAITSVFRRDTDIKTQYIEKEYFGKLSK